jgi:isopenicillin-N N-acyltransferase-like protein
MQQEINIPPQFIHPDPLPIIRVKGTHREMGRQIGETFRTQIQHHVENTRELINTTYETLELDWEGARMQGRKYIPFAQERYPEYVEEMYGISEGAKVDFDDVGVVNALEAVTIDALHLSKCTSIAVSEANTADGHVLIGHNEDWIPEDEQDVFLVHAEPKNDPPFLAMTYGALLPNIGLNAYGMAQCCDSVYPTDSRIGIPRLVVSRAVLAARTPTEAMRQILVPHRAAGYNHLLAHESGEIYSVEVSSRKFAILSAQDGYMVHTNHYLDPNMQLVEYEPDELISTRVRYFRADRLLRASVKHTIKSIQAIQRDHINFPNSICNHTEEDMDPLDREKTVNSMVIDLTARAMHIAWGNPCVNSAHTYHLDA